jgi:transcription initiation factor TFIIF subunit beta
MQPKMKMLIDPSIPEHRAVPKEYDLDIQGMNVENVYAFSEQDMPGFKAKSKSRSDAISSGIPLSALKPKAGKVEKPRFERGRREPYYRKAIPKKTKIYGKIMYELNCAPQHVEEQNHLLQAQISEVEKGGTMKIIHRPLGNIRGVGTNRGAEWDNKFIKNQPKLTKAKKLEQKTTRVAENELIDMLFAAFSKFAYWPMRALKAHVRQPEAWLRETLDKIAVLQKTGTFANTWMLKDEYLLMVKSQNLEGAPDVAESDDEELMEDVA